MHIFWLNLFFLFNLNLWETPAPSELCDCRMYSTAVGVYEQDSNFNCSKFTSHVASTYFFGEVESKLVVGSKLIRIDLTDFAAW